MRTVCPLQVTELRVPPQVLITLKSPLSHKGEDTAKTCVLVSSDYCNKMPHSVYFSHFLQVQDKGPDRCVSANLLVTVCRRYLHQAESSCGRSIKGLIRAYFMCSDPFVHTQSLLRITTILGDRNTIYECVREQIARP